ncbi:helix-turn-helix transcriptional regulator [Sphingobium sp. JS3065]|jgi:DNA-binding CsgD family transcriptional regulator|uniref:helix-turn-helix transcriptional regulator n=1 Tax=Sphingobium sp. JS3065 TaxID=2970925 RepID=UPI002263F499|nr:helix-turn-helix transcriptional regulator [Sphingobium sp. JS3065]UZW56397.1 helix-turn-helix transcriptional regulator [Sphingobium sp. JS3065]
MIESIEAAGLRECIANMAAAHAEADIEIILARAGSLLGLPLHGYHRDASRPSYSAETYRVLADRGWPVEALELRWKGSGTILLRLRSAGSVIIIDTERTARDKTATPQHRAVSAIHAKHGIKTLLGVPVPRPAGRTATLYFGGPRAPSDFARIHGEISSKLLALGHLALEGLEGPISETSTLDRQLLELTTREWDCLHLLVEGYRDKEIAEMTGTKMTTVRYHLDNVVQKLNARSRTHAVAIASQLNWLEVPFRNEPEMTQDEVDL